MRVEGSSGSRRETGHDNASRVRDGHRSMSQSVTYGPGAHGPQTFLPAGVWMSGRQARVAGDAVSRRTPRFSGSALAMLAPPAERERSPHGDGSEHPRAAAVSGMRDIRTSRTVEERQPGSVPPDAGTGRHGLGPVGCGHADRPRRPPHRSRHGRQRPGRLSARRATDSHEKLGTLGSAGVPGAGECQDQ
jgi:hypothetical protein